MSAEFSMEVTPSNVEEETAQTLPEFCFVPAIAGQLTERERVMLACMISRAGDKLAPGDLGEQIGDAKQPATRMKVTTFLSKAESMPGLQDLIERGGHGKNRYCKWTGEPAEVVWSEAIPPLPTGYSKAAHQARHGTFNPWKPTRSANFRVQKPAAARQANKPPTPEAAPYPALDVVPILRDEERARNIFESWQLRIDDQQGERSISYQGNVIKGIDGLGVDIIEVAAQVAGELSVGDLRGILHEYAEEQLGFKGVIDRLLIIKEAFESLGIEGWTDEEGREPNGTALRLVDFAPRPPA